MKIRKTITWVIALAITVLPLKIKAMTVLEDVSYKQFDITDVKDIKRYKARTNHSTNPNAKLENTEWLVMDKVDDKLLEGDLIAINKSLNTLTLYQNNIITYKAPVAIGKPNEPTPSGVRTVINRVPNPRYGGLNGKYKPVAGGAPNNPLGKYWMGIGGAYGIHGTLWENTIGTQASGGCIRMLNKDIEELFNLVTVGTKVIVGTNEELEKQGIVQTSIIQNEDTKVETVDLFTGDMFNKRGEVILNIK